VVLAEAGDVGDDAEVVEGERSVAKLFKVGGPTDEHVVEPGREGNGDVAAYGHGVDRFAVGTFSRFLVPRKAVNAGGVASVETDEAGTDQVAVLADVEAGDEVIVVNVTLGWGVPSFGDLAEVFFEVGDDVLKAGDLGGVLRGAGLDRESEAMNELLELLGGNVGVSVEGGEY